MENLLQLVSFHSLLYSSVLCLVSPPLLRGEILQVIDNQRLQTEYNTLALAAGRRNSRTQLPYQLNQLISTYAKRYLLNY